MPFTENDRHTLGDREQRGMRADTSTADRPLREPQLSVFVTEPHLGLRVVHVMGEIDLSTAPQLRDDLRTQLSYRPDALILDFGAVSFLAVCGLSVLGELANEAGEQGVRLRLVATDRSVCRPLELTRLTERIPCHAALYDALNFCLD